jgi:signal transduction histidine kinase
MRAQSHHRDLKRGDRFSVIVSDTETGVIEATPEALFTLFEYKDRDETKLSLPIARRVVRAHGGDIFFEADPEKGTTCTLELPIGL